MTAGGFVLSKMNYEQIKELSLEELIEECKGTRIENSLCYFFTLEYSGDCWLAYYEFYVYADDPDIIHKSEGSTPKEAVFNLLLELNEVKERIY